MTNPLTTATTSRPDVTPAQKIGLLVSGVPIVASMLRAFGVYDVTPEQLAALNDAVQWGAIAAGLLFVSDAGLRVGRSLAQGKVDAAAIAPTPVAGTTGELTLEPLGAPVPPPGHRIVTTVEPLNSGGGVTTADSGVGMTLPTAAEAEAMRPVDAGAEDVPPEDLPSDEQEAAAPPPDDDSATPVDPDADAQGIDPAGAPPS